MAIKTDNRIVFDTEDLEYPALIDFGNLSYEIKVPKFILKYFEPEPGEVAPEEDTDFIFEEDDCNSANLDHLYIVEELYSSTNGGMLETDWKRINELWLQAWVHRRHEGTIFIYGERGSGKELLARYLFRKGPRSNKKFVSINCATIPKESADSHLFGHVKGAFTGAVSTRKGLFEQANGGVLFLDEIHHLPLDVQSKLLRALDQNEIVRFGDSKTISVDVQVYAASNIAPDDIYKRDVEKPPLIIPDLLDRLYESYLSVPSLFERTDKEKKALATYFILKSMKKNNTGKIAIPENHFTVLWSTPYAGNIREMANRCASYALRAAMFGESAIDSYFESLSPETRRRIEAMKTSVIFNEWMAAKSLNPFRPSPVAPKGAVPKAKGLKDIYKMKWRDAKEEFMRLYLQHHLDENPGISTDDLARKLGVDNSTIWRVKKSL